MKEYNFKEYVKRKMENISDVLNIVKKSVNELKENANHLPKFNEVKLIASAPMKRFYGESETLEPSCEYYYNNLIWSEDSDDWIETPPTIYHMEWNVEEYDEITYDTNEYLYTTEYVAILYFDENNNNLGYQLHYGDGQTPYSFNLKLPQGTTKIHSYSNYYYVIYNSIRVLCESEKPKEDLHGSLDKTTYSFVLKKPNTESTNPFYESINYISLDYIDINGDKKTIEIPPIVEHNKYNDLFKKINYEYYDYDSEVESRYSFEINNYGYDDEYKRYVSSAVHVKITCDTFVESDVSTFGVSGGSGELYTFYCEATDIHVSYINVDNKIRTGLIENVDFNKITNLPPNIEKQVELDSVVFTLDDLAGLYQDVSNFDVNDVNSMNHCPQAFESTATLNTITDDDYFLVDKRGISILNLYTDEVGGRGVKFTIPAKQIASVWVEWQPRLSAELYSEEGELLDTSYENRDSDYAYTDCYRKNIFEIKNSEDVALTYYIIFKSHSNYVYYNRVFDVKVLLKGKLDNTIKPTEDKVENNNVVLNSNRYQKINVMNCDVLNLTLPTEQDYEEIHLHIRVAKADLLMYNSSISGSNTWNGYGYSSQYIPVEGGSSFSFYPNVTTANIEILQYTDTNNARGTYISKNTTVTLNANTRYVKLNMWDNPGSIPATMVINGIEYTLIPTEKPLITETTVFEAGGEGEVTLTFSEPCETYGVDKLEYGNIYELELIKSYGKWICRNPNNVGSSGGSTDMTSEDILDMFMEMDLIQPIADENNVVFTDSDGKIFIL